MEGINPLLESVLFLRYQIEVGNSIKQAHLLLIEQTTDLHWKKCIKSAKSEVPDEKLSPYRKAFLQILAQGLKGDPIYQSLMALEEDILEACIHEVEVHVAGLPVKGLIPLLLFQFPAFLILLVGPLLIELMREL